MAITFRSATEAGTTAAATNVSINVPSGVQDGDLLLLFCCTSDGDTGSVSPSGTWQGPIVNNVNTGGSAPSPPGMSVYWRIASSEPASYTITDTESSGISGQMMAFIGVDQTTPIDATSQTATGDSTNANPPSITYVDGNGAGVAIAVGAVWDSTTAVYSAVPSGFTSPDSLGAVTGTGGGNGHTHATAYNLSPSASPYDPPAFTSSTEQWAAATVVLRAATTEGIQSVTPEEFDMDEASVTIAGQNFGASQGSGTVYISDADTLAGSANEVEIANGINTWSDTSINLDLTGLNATELSNLQTLGPGTRYIIIVTNASDEYGSSAITLHRPEAFVMSLGAGTPGATTARLTAPSGKTTGDFDAGRFEEVSNPGTAVDITTDNYTEMVWSIEATALSQETTYKFRVTVGGTPLTSASVSPAVSISAGTTIPCSVDTLTITEYAATISQAVNISAAVDNLTLTEYPATALLDVNITAGADALSITEYAATIAYDIGISATTDALNLTEYPATVQADIDTNIDATVDALAITEYAADIQANIDVNIDGQVDALTLTEYPATVEALVNVEISAQTDSLTITEYPATVQALVNTDISAQVDALSITEYPATVGQGLNIDANTDALTVTEYSATVQANVDINVDATTDALTITEYQANIEALVATEINAQVDALTVTEYPAALNIAQNLSINRAALQVNGAGGPAAYYNGNSAIYRNALVTDPTDTKTGILAVTVKRAAVGSQQTILWEGAGKVQLYFNSNDNIQFTLRTQALGYDVFSRTTTNTFTSTSDWYNILIAWDSSIPALQMYVNDVDQSFSASGGTINYLVGYASSPWLLGMDNAFTSRFNGSITQLYFDKDNYLDMDTTTNRRKFFDASGNLVDLGPTGSLPTGTQPLIYFPDGGLTDNVGFGGSFPSVYGSSPASVKGPSTSSATITFDVGIQAGVDALTVTEYSAIVQAGENVNLPTNVDTLSITEYPANVNAEKSISASQDALSLTEYSATVNVGLSIACSADNLSVTEYPATVVFNAQVQASTDALTVTEYQAIVSTTQDVFVNATTDALALTEYPAAITAGQTVVATVDALTLATYPATLTFDYNILTVLETLTVTERKATIDTGVQAPVSGGYLGPRTRTRQPSFEELVQERTQREQQEALIREDEEILAILVAAMTEESIWHR